MDIDALIAAPHDFQEIRIENTNRCGYSCVFCPREKMDRPQDIMPMDDFGLVMERIAAHSPDYGNWLHLHGYGEPLLDKYLPEKVSIAKALFPRARTLIITTLGVNVGENYLRALIDNGLDSLYVSFYASTREGYKQVTGTNMFDTALKNLIALGRIAPSAPHLKVTVSGEMQGIADKSGVDPQSTGWLKTLAEKYGFAFYRPRIHNYGNGRAYNVTEKQGLCTVFTGNRRNILQITWDLTVKPCSFDFNASMALGNLRAQSIDAILKGAAYRNLARAQMTGDLSAYPVCANCDKHSDA